MSWSMSMLFTCIGVLYITTPSHTFVTGPLAVIGCQGATIPISHCSNPNAIYSIKSITVLTNHDTDSIKNSTEQCWNAEECRRTIHSSEDAGISDEYIYLYNWVMNRCNGKHTCDEDSVMPSYWELIDDFTVCGKGQTQHFAGALLDVECRVGEEIVTYTQPPDTTPRTRPTTPTTTTPFAVLVPIYLPELIGREKVILGVAIGLAVAILIFLLIVLYCCEWYRSNRKIAKLMRMLGAPQAQDDNFDDFEDYGKTDAWKEETDANFDALGEYTGVKPNEFMTLDKKAMESTGQIMYDTSTTTMTMGRGNSCSTLSRNSKINSSPSGPAVNYGYSGPTDFETAENLELERRMAETLNERTSFDEDTSYH